MVAEVSASWAWVAAGVMALAHWGGALAHAGIDAQIRARTAAIKRRPGDAGLLLARAELHRQHRDWVAARADVDRAEAIAPGSSEVDMARGRLALDMGDGSLASMLSGRVLERIPRHVPALLMRARSFRVMGDHFAAAKAFEEVLAVSPNASVDLYLEAAAEWRAVGTGDEECEKALAVIDQGIAKLGSLVALQTEAIAVERALRRPQQALARVARLQSRAERKEAWLVQRGDLLVEAGHPREAGIAFREALDAIAMLPPSIQGHEFVRELAQHALGQLRLLNAETGEQP